MSLLARRARGVSAIEILVGTAIFAVIAIPILSMLYKSREAEQVSRFQYLALLAARDQMYRSRFTVGVGGDPSTVLPGPRKLEGGVMDDMTGIFLADQATPMPDYDGEQKRITVKLTWTDVNSNPPRPRLKLGQVEAEWLEDAPGSTDRPGERPDSVRLVFGALKPPGSTP